MADTTFVTKERWEIPRFAATWAAIQACIVLGAIPLLTRTSTSKPWHAHAWYGQTYFAIAILTDVLITTLLVHQFFGNSRQAESDRRFLEDEALRLMREKREIQNVFDRDTIMRRDAEAQLQRALDEEHKVVLRLQELDRAKNDFVSSVSHELRSPLTSTLGFLEILGDGSAGALNDEQARMVEIAGRNGHRLLALIEDLLMLSHIESGAFSIHYSPIDISEMLSHAIDKWVATASAQEVNIEFDLPKGDLGVLPGDEHQMQKALDNVIGNAVKFTSPGGRVTIAVRKVNDTLTFVISDNGIGISIEEQSQLFKRFFRSSVAVEQAFPGAGLGLTIARAVVEHHGGTIDITSAQGIGTTVTIQLPALPTFSSQTRKSSVNN